MKNALGKLIVTGLGTGYLPVAPGTWGSAAVAGLYLLLVWTTEGQQPLVLNAVMAAVAVAASAGCVAWGKFTERTWGRKDPGACTIDEWAGQAVALLAMPLAVCESFAHAAVLTGIAFVLFRVFDIVKPFPARRMEKLPHGWGVLADDLVAGVYANITAQLLIRLTPVVAWVASLGQGG
ncbi:MAG: phosphatidylglycerophosphatase A family protein [Planctomycetota bacterium]|jgi:phosphatidylglycerophosphatase A